MVNVNIISQPPQKLAPINVRPTDKPGEAAARARRRSGGGGSSSPSPEAKGYETITGKKATTKEEILTKGSGGRTLTRKERFVSAARGGITKGREAIGAIRERVINPVQERVKEELFERPSAPFLDKSGIGYKRKITTEDEIALNQRIESFNEKYGNKELSEKDYEKAAVEERNIQSTQARVQAQREEIKKLDKTGAIPTTFLGIPLKIVPRRFTEEAVTYPLQLPTDLADIGLNIGERGVNVIERGGIARIKRVKNKEGKTIAIEDLDKFMSRPPKKSEIPFPEKIITSAEEDPFGTIGQFAGSLVVSELIRPGAKTVTSAETGFYATRLAKIRKLEKAGKLEEAQALAQKSIKIKTPELIANEIAVAKLRNERIKMGATEKSLIETTKELTKGGTVSAPRMPGILEVSKGEFTKGKIKYELTPEREIMAISESGKLTKIADLGELKSSPDILRGKVKYNYAQRVIKTKQGKLGLGVSYRGKKGSKLVDAEYYLIKFPKGRSPFASVFPFKPARLSTRTIKAGDIKLKQFDIEAFNLGTPSIAKLTKQKRLEIGGQGFKAFEVKYADLGLTFKKGRASPKNILELATGKAPSSKQLATLYNRQLFTSSTTRGISRKAGKNPYTKATLTKNLGVSELNIPKARGSEFRFQGGGRKAPRTSLLTEQIQLQDIIPKRAVKFKTPKSRIAQPILTSSRANLLAPPIAAIGLAQRGRTKQSLFPRVKGRTKVSTFEGQLPRESLFSATGLTAIPKNRARQGESLGLAQRSSLALATASIQKQKLTEVSRPRRATRFLRGRAREPISDFTLRKRFIFDFDLPRGKLSSRKRKKGKRDRISLSYAPSLAGSQLGLVRNIKRKDLSKVLSTGTLGIRGYLRIK